MRVSELEGKNVVGVADGQKLGKIQELRVDPDRRAVTGVVVSKNGLFGKLNKQVIEYGGLQGIGRAAATIPNTEALVDLDSNKSLLTTPKASDLHRPVLTSTGDQVGAVEDLEFDPQSGALTGIVVDPTEVYRSPYGGKMLIEMSHIMTLSTGNVIVNETAVAPPQNDDTQHPREQAA